jgi:hypothetical protein
MLDALNHPVVFLLGLSIGIAAVWAILRVVLDKVGLSQFAALFGGGK